MCFVVLYATVYLPLHGHDGVNYGAALRGIDLLAFGSGLAAIAIGTLALMRRGGNPTTTQGVLLALAGTPTLILALLWSFPQTFHLTIFPVPFYFGYVFFTDLGVAHLGEGYVPLVLVIACAAVVVSGVMMAAPAAARPLPPAAAR